MTLAENWADRGCEPGHGIRGGEYLSRFLREHPIKIRRLARACGGRCEHCGFSYPLSLLSVHIIDPPDDPAPTGFDLQNLLLVLCPACLSLFAGYGVSREQKQVLVRLRPEETSKAMQKILMFKPRHYSPPASRDFAELFEEIMSGGSPDLCLNGG